MKKNDKIEFMRWYRHPGMLDTVIFCTYVDSGIAEVSWFNVSGQKPFFIDSEFLPLEAFKKSPFWEDVTYWMTSNLRLEE